MKVPNFGDDVTVLLRAWRSGDQAAFETVAPFLYRELRRVAQCYLRGERPDHTLTPTALIHEVYLRLLGQSQNQPEWTNRKHFLGIAARMMRQILVDFARRKHAGKRGAGAPRVQLDAVEAATHPPNADWIDVAAAIERLEEIDPRKVRVLEMRYFAGLTLEEAGEVLDLSPATISRELHLAEAWLARELRGASAGEKYVVA